MTSVTRPSAFLALLALASFIAARSRLLGLGRAVEVLEPESLRKSLVDFADQIVKLYKK